MCKVVLFLAGVVLIGCEKKPSLPTLEDTNKISPHLNDKDYLMSHYRVYVGRYLAESREGAKMLALSPSVEEVTKLYQATSDRYRNYLSPPLIKRDWIDPKVDERLSKIATAFGNAEFYTKEARKAERDKAFDRVREVHEKLLPKLAEEVRGLADEIEAALKLSK